MVFALDVLLIIQDKYSHNSPTYLSNIQFKQRPILK